MAHPWVSIANKVVTGQIAGLRCPFCLHEPLTVRWIPLPDARGGEFHVLCLHCEAETYVLTRNDTVLGDDD